MALDTGLTPVSMLGAHTAVPVQGQLVAGCHAPPPETTRQRGHRGLSPAQAIAWATEAADMTFSLAPALLVATRYDGIPGVTGALVWVREAGHEACPSLAVPPPCTACSHAALQ